MASTSGTVSNTTIDVNTHIEHAFRRAGVPTAEMTPENVQAAKHNLYFYLSALSNDGVNLWTIEKKVLGLIAGKSRYTLDDGDLEVKTALRRTITYPDNGTEASSAGGTASYAFDKILTTACTQTSPNGNISYVFSSATKVSVVGFMPYANSTYTLVFEYYDAFGNWVALKTLDQEDYIAGEWYLWDLDFSPTATSYRMRETGNGTLNIIEVVFGTVELEIPVARTSFDQYSNLTNKNIYSDTALQYWFDRKIEAPEMVLWPVPSNSFEQLVVWKTRQIQDVGALTNKLELPQRWIEASITALACRLMLELPKVDKERYGILKKEAEEATYRAQQEERDKSPIFISPNIGCYTR